jgi:NAD(P)-dependent dehydrogenase (short-subunit alcohol dehydrogenase family)
VVVDLGFNDAVVLVTGGARGVGEGITRVFLRLGATVVTCARHEPEHPVRVGDNEADFVQSDVRDAEQAQQLISTVVDRYGRLDVLVNNAGGSPAASAASASPRFHAKIVELNLLAPLLLSQLANGVMQEQETGGSIVMVSSISGRRPSPGTAAYGAAKAGLDNLTASLAVEWAPKVRVNALAVGLVNTGGAQSHYQDTTAIAETIAMGRFAEPIEVGNCAAFLASPLASYVSGATIPVHGGGEIPAFLMVGRQETTNGREAS